MEVEEPAEDKYGEECKGFSLQNSICKAICFQQQEVRAEITHLTAQIEGLNGSECRKWWQETLDADLIKWILIRAQVRWPFSFQFFPSDYLNQFYEA